MANEKTGFAIGTLIGAVLAGILAYYAWTRPTHWTNRLVIIIYILGVVWNAYLVWGTGTPGQVLPPSTSPPANA